MKQRTGHDHGPVHVQFPGAGMLQQFQRLAADLITVLQQHLSERSIFPVKNMDDLQRGLFRGSV